MGDFSDEQFALSSDKRLLHIFRLIIREKERNRTGFPNTTVRKLLGPRPSHWVVDIVSKG